VGYAAGLRVSEIVHLRVEDIDSRRGVIHVREGKGKKDRYVPLSPRLLEELRGYWRVVRPRPYLFPGADPGRPVRGDTFRRVCRRAGLRPGVVVEGLPAAEERAG
jgi:integrase